MPLMLSADCPPMLTPALTLYAPMDIVTATGVATSCRGRESCQSTYKVLLRLRWSSSPRQGDLCSGLACMLIIYIPEQVVPILRAGLVLLEQAATVLPNSQTFHVGYVRNEETLEVSLPGALSATHWCQDMSGTHLCISKLLDYIEARANYGAVWQHGWV